MSSRTSSERVFLDTISRQNTTIKDLTDRIDKILQMSHTWMDRYFHARAELQNANRGIHNLRKRLNSAKQDLAVMREGQLVQWAMENHLREQGVDVSAAYVHVANHPELVEKARAELARQKRGAYESSKKREPVGVEG